MRYDASRGDLRTESIHYFESEEQREGRVQFPNKPVVAVDPENRCAAVRVFENKLAVLIFASAGADDGANNNNDDGDDKRRRRNFVRGHHVLDLRKLGVRNIKDMVFLDGYFEPTILFLHEREPTWAGQLAQLRGHGVRDGGLRVPQVGAHGL